LVDGREVGLNYSSSAPGPGGEQRLQLRLPATNGTLWLDPIIGIAESDAVVNTAVNEVLLGSNAALGRGLGRATALAAAAAALVLLAL
jgi:hypothetical protein